MQGSIPEKIVCQGLTILKNLLIPFQLPLLDSIQAEQNSTPSLYEIGIPVKHCLARLIFPGLFFGII